MLRPYLLARHEGLPPTAAFATIILERLLDLVTVLLLFGVFVLLVDPASLSGDPAMYGRVKAGGLLAARPRRSPAWPCFSSWRGIPSAWAPGRCGSSGCCRRSWRARVAGFVETFAQGLAVMRQPGRLLVSLILSFPLWLSIAAGIWVSSRAFHMTFGYLGSFLVMTLLVVGVAMPTPGQVGGFQAMYKIAVVTFFGVAGRRGRSPRRSSLHAISFVPVTLLGLVFMAREGLSLGARCGKWPRRRKQGRDQMKCPFCGNLGDKVVDSRESKEGNSIRRRRECLGCGKRYTSREHIEEIEYRVIKKDGRPEPFNRQKLIGGLVRACEKRPVSVQQLEGIADRIESELQDRPEREIKTTDIGAFIMDELRRIDQVAYVRFASVYRQFRDVGEFKREIDELQRNKT